MFCLQVFAVSYYFGPFYKIFSEEVGCAWFVFFGAGGGGGVSDEDKASNYREGN